MFNGDTKLIIYDILQNVHNIWIGPPISNIFLMLELEGHK